MTAVTALSEIRRNRDLWKPPPDEQYYSQEINWLLVHISTLDLGSLEFRRRAFGLLRDVYLPKPQHLAERPVLGQYSFSWLEAICSLPRHSYSLNHAILAFCMTQVCLARIGDVSREQALQSYSRGIECLQADLEDSQARYHEETISSILLLSVCEVRRPNSYIALSA